MPFRVAISERAQGVPTDGKLNLVLVLCPNFILRGKIRRGTTPEWRIPQLITVLTKMVAY